MAKKFRPLGDRILIKIDEKEDTHKGGLIVKVDTSKDKEAPKTGVVISTGEGMLDREGKIHPPRVKVGDNIMFGMYSGQVVEINYESFLILKDGDILGVLEDHE